MSSPGGHVLALAGASLAATAVAAVLATSGFGAPAGNRAAHPNPAVVNIAVDYAASPRTPDGKPANLGPLTPAVVAQALNDQRYLAYQTVGDLGGFKPAPVGHLAWSGGGHAIVGGTFKSQVPHYAKAGGGQVNSFALIGSATPKAVPPDNGRQPVPGIGVPPTTPPASSTPVPPPANQGFAGTPPTPATTTAPPATTSSPPPTTTPTPPPPTTTTTTTRTRTAPPTITTAPATTTTPPVTTTATTTAATTTTATTTAATTTAATTTSGGTSTSSSSSSSSTCGTTGLSITSDHSSCVLYATNMAPGDSTSEVMTVENTADVAYSLYLRATGTQNQLWNDLKLAVWQVGSAAPSPLPPLLDWTTQDNKLALSPLQPGDSVKLNVELLLPSTAGNADQNLKAVIAFVWKATS